MTRIRTCLDWRPITAQIGGRSLSYVPRPRRLLARLRGGSCGSPCHSLFFPRVLEHFVGFDFQIAQRCLWLGLLRIGLQLMPHLSRSCSADTQFACYLGCWRSLTHRSNKQNGLLWTKVTPFKYRSTVQIVNALTLFTAIDIQLTAFRLSKPVRFIKCCSTVGALHPFRMKVSFYPVETCFSIH